MHTYNFHPKPAFTILKTHSYRWFGFYRVLHQQQNNLQIIVQQQSESFSTRNPFIYAPWHTSKHTLAYPMYRFGLIGLAWSSTIMDSTMELVSSNGDHHWDGLIVPTTDHFKSIRGGVLWPEREQRERMKIKNLKSCKCAGEWYWRHWWNKVLHTEREGGYSYCNLSFVVLLRYAGFKFH